MPARFRIRTKEGQELSFASHEVFAEFVRSGDLSPDDVVYDADTREWSPARTHPVVLQIELEAEEDSRRASEADEEGAGEAGGDESEAGLDFELAPAQAGLTPEQEAAAFVAKMEAERASERDLDEDVPGFKMERGAASVVEEFAAPPPPPPPPPPAPPPRRRGRSRNKSPSVPKAVPAAPKKKAKKKEGSRAVWRYAPFVILGLAGVGAGVYFGPELFTSTGGSDTDADTVAPPQPPPEIASTEEAVRARARERFLTATQAALRGLDQVPDIWLHGSYLAAPSDYPEVRAVFEQYVLTIRDLRATDEERYRTAYLRALDDARVVEGGTRTLRLSGALTTFQAAGAARQEHYDRVESLALAAIRGHDGLVQAEGTIMYQPATGPALSADPVIEAVGRSPEAQAFLNQILDVILAELHAERGPGESSNVREWVWDGILEAVTS